MPAVSLVKWGYQQLLLTTLLRLLPGSNQNNLLSKKELGEFRCHLPKQNRKLVWSRMVLVMAHLSHIMSREVTTINSILPVKCYKLRDVTELRVGARGSLGLSTPS